jgi:hypothetical protein
MVLRYSFQNYHPELTKRNDQMQSFAKLNTKLVQYAKLLADQGCFLNAYSYINDSNDSSILVMKDRLYHVLDPATIQQYRLRKPEYPFKTANVSNAKSNVSHQQMSSAQPQPQQTVNNRKLSYHQVTDPSVTTANKPIINQPNAFTYPTTNSSNTNTVNKLPSVNHPMPLSSLYRSTTPIAPNQQMQQPPVMNTMNTMNTQPPTGPMGQANIFTPSIPTNTTPVNTGRTLNCI